jgi:hypothetical protein
MRKRGEMNLLRFEKKNKGEELTKADAGTRHPLPSSGTAIREAARTSSSSNRAATRGPYETMSTGAGNCCSSGGTTIEGPCGTRTSSSSSGTATRGPGGNSSTSKNQWMPGGTAAVIGYDNNTSSSTTCMHFMLGTTSSSSLMRTTPNSSFIVSNVICKYYSIPK